MRSRRPPPQGDLWWGIAMTACAVLSAVFALLAWVFG